MKIKYMKIKIHDFLRPKSIQSIRYIIPSILIIIGQSIIYSRYSNFVGSQLTLTICASIRHFNFIVPILDPVEPIERAPKVT